MKKADAHPPRKRPLLVSGDGSGGTSMTAIQLPSNVGGSVVDDGFTQANPITLGDSSDDDNGGATTSKVNNNEILSFTYCYLVACIWMYDDLYTGRLSYF